MAKTKEKEPTVHAQGCDGNPWDAWNALLAKPGVTARYMHSPRATDVVLSVMGRELARRTDTTTRGSVTAVHFLFAPPEVPRFLLLDDNGASADRYTLFFTIPVDGEIHFVGFDANPYHPMGIGQHGSMPLRDWNPRDLSSIGAPIDFSALPPKARELAEAFIRECEEIKP